MKKNTNEKFSQIICTNLKELSIDFLQVNLDDFSNDFLKNRIFKNRIFIKIPLVNSIISLIEIIKSFKDYFLFKKIYLFIYELKDIDNDTRKKFLEKIEKEDKNFIDNLLLSIERHDNFLRSKLQGRIFYNLILNKINHEEYQKFTWIISNIDLTLLPKLKLFYKEKKVNLSESEKICLSNFQLIDFDTKEVGLWNGGGPTYNKNDLGKKLISILE